MNLRTRFSKKELTDSGLALLLLTLLSGIWLSPPLVLKIAIVEAVALLGAPFLLWPFALLWLNLSELLGWVMSKVILTAIFVFVVCPVGLFRKIVGKDSLLLRQFKRNNHSVFKDRSGTPDIDFTNQY